MTFEDARKQWQSEFARPVSAVDLPRLLADAQQRISRLERSIHLRDLREILAALFVVVAFAAGWPIFRASLVASAGAALIILAALAVIYVFISAKRPQAPPLSASVLECSRQRLAWIDRQIRLLQTVPWWYVAPLFTGCLLIAWGLTAGRRQVFLILLILDVLVAIATVCLNRHSVRTQLRPARQELVNLIEALEPANAG